ncbi:MAG TPA: hypothetical protein VKM55_29715 [Candidatus Lokiarchaeia archaeon]|nr:hypothetical protein [Candidatus Lokiarchaeia archaeon]
MVDIPLEDLGKFLDDIIADRFKKLKKIGKKMLDDIHEDIKYIYDQLDTLGKKINPDKDDLVTRAATRFISGMQTEINDFEFPSGNQVTYADLKKVLDFLLGLFNNYNDNGKKWIPKFREEYKLEIKTIESSVMRVFRLNGELDRFSRAKYGDVKNAEDMTDKIEKLNEMIEKYNEDRKKIDELTATIEQLKGELEDLENQMLELEHDPLVEEQNRCFREENTLKQQIQQELSKIKKSIKKFEKVLDSSPAEPRYVSKKETKDYFKNLFESLIVDGPEYPKLRGILENILGSLQDEVQLKDDKKEKVQDIIKAMKDEYSLKPLIEAYLAVVENRKACVLDIQEKGTSRKIAVLKQKISDMTMQKNHAEADLQHEKENVVNSLSKMKAFKENFEKEIFELSKQKINIQLEI